MSDLRTYNGARRYPPDGEHTDTPCMICPEHPWIELIALPEGLFYCPFDLQVYPPRDSYGYTIVQRGAP